MWTEGADNDYPRSTPKGQSSSPLRPNATPIRNHRHMATRQA